MINGFHQIDSEGNSFLELGSSLVGNLNFIFAADDGSLFKDEALYRLIEKVDIKARKGSPGNRGY